MAAERSTITLGGKGASFSSSSVYKIASGVANVRIDSSAIERFSTKPLPLTKRSSFGIPEGLTNEEIRASLAVLLNKLLLSNSGSVRSVLPVKVLEFLNSKDETFEFGEIEVTEGESVVLEKSCASLVGVCSVIDHKSTALSQIVDSVSALSCEATKGDISSFSSLDSGDGFGNKDAISVAGDLKALLNGSKAVGKVEIEEVSKIPRIHGKFRDVVRSVHSDARVELNTGVKGGKTGSGNSAIGEALGTTLLALFLSREVFAGTDPVEICKLIKKEKMGEKQRKLLVLYASQTGNALDAAERIGREAERRGCHASIISTDDYDASSLPHEEAVVFVVSTTGQGDSPDSFKEFWRFLLQRNLGNSWLQRLRFAVFGLGDSGYQKYNFVAKKLDKRLLDLGATTIIDKGLGDDQHPSGYEATLDPWMLSLWSTLYQINPKYFPRGPDVVISQDQLIDQPKYRILYHKQETLEPNLMAESDIIQRARGMSPGKLSKDKSKPDCFLKMTKNEVLTKDGSTKDVRHFEFQFVSSSIKYEVGDVVELLPSQNSSAIDAFIERCDLDRESFITVHPRETESSGSCGELITHVPIKLKTFVELTMDVTSASPRRYFFEVMSFYAIAEHEKERLQYFASPEGRDDLYNYNQKERRSVLEVLEDFPSVQMPFEWLVQLVPSLKPRAFSISSSPLAHPAQVHLTVSVVSWSTPYGRPRKGLCSSWLASLTPEQEINIPVWFHKGSLPAPPQSLPLILVGPGTGCAPFRGFIAERAVQAQTSPVAPVMFFFGCRNKDTDFLYRDFWESHATEGGMLCEKKGGGFYTAFSRDQPKKVYVQHKIREMRKKVWDLLCDGAAVYVAGSSTKMPSDVMSALEEIVMEETGGSKEMATRWLKALEKAGRYNVEAWP